MWFTWVYVYSLLGTRTVTDKTELSIEIFLPESRSRQVSELLLKFENVLVYVHTYFLFYGVYDHTTY